MVNVRGDELNKLNSFFERKESSLVVLYREHLSGVSSLWQEFAEEKDSVYLKASYASLCEQSYLWAKRFGHFFNSEELYSMDSALEAALLSGEETSETFSVFTPGEDTFGFSCGDAVAFHGTSDPWADTGVIRECCREQGIPLYETEGANHSLETGDVEKDIKVSFSTITFKRKNRINTKIYRINTSQTEP